MASEAHAPVSKKMLWTGYILSALPSLLLIFSAVMKFMGSPEVAQEMGRLGYAEGVIVALGVTELACTILYLIPQTSVLGAILLTGYLGGATATHVRVGDSSFFTPVILGIVIWGGLFLRDPRLRALIPLRR